MKLTFVRSFLRKCVVIVVYLTCLPAYGADVLITVLEKGTGDPVSNANVILMESEDYVVTDEQGRATLNVLEELPPIKILATGYETLSVPLAPENGKAIFYIVPVSLESTGFEVVAERLPEKVSKISMTAEELAHAPGSQGDPLIAVQSLPGIVVAEDGGGQVYMRGSDVHDNNTFVNRVPVGYLYHFGGFRSTINQELISDLNVFLGGFPVHYGDALGGVFDVRLREPRSDKHRYHFDISTIESNFVVEGPAGQGSADGYYFAARRSYIDLIFSPSDFTDFTSDDDKDESETNQFITVPEYWDVQGLYRHPVSHGYLDFYYFSAGDKLAFENREDIKSDPQLAGDTVSDQSFHTLGMTWRAQVDSQWKIDMPLVFFVDKNRLQIGTDDLGNPFFVDNEQQSLHWKPQWTFQQNEHRQYLFGVDAGYYKIPLNLYISRPPLEEDPIFDFTDQNKYRVKDTIYAFQYDPYFQYRQQWNNSLTSILGLRYSKITGTGGISVEEFSPRLALEYQATPSTLLTASWGRYVQLPLGFQVLEGFGNPDLEFTRAEHRILGVEQQVNSTWSIKTEIYQKPMEDLVVSIDDQPPPGNYANLGEGEAYGIDIYIKRERRNGVMGWLSYSYAHTERFNPLKPENGDRDFSGDQPHTLTLVWSQPFSVWPFQWAKNMNRWNWGIKLVAHSGKPYTDVVGRELEDPMDPDSRYIPVTGKHNAERTPDYYRLDLRLERDILRNTSRMKFYIDIINVLNRNNVTDYDYGDEYENFNNPDEITGLPFFPFIGFEMDF